MMQKNSYFSITNNIQIWIWNALYTVLNSLSKLGWSLRDEVQGDRNGWFPTWAKTGFLINPVGLLDTSEEESNMHKCELVMLALKTFEQLPF